MRSLCVLGRPPPPPPPPALFGKKYSLPDAVNFVSQEIIPTRGLKCLRENKFRSQYQIFIVG